MMVRLLTFVAACASFGVHGSGDLPERRRQFIATSAGAAGLGIGWLATPRLTPQDRGKVRTAEAWRRKIKGRSRVPLVVRSPQIVGFAVACYTLAECKLAVDAGEPFKTSVAHTTLGVVLSDSIELASRLKSRVALDARRLQRTFVASHHVY